MSGVPGGCAAGAAIVSFTFTIAIILVVLHRILKRKGITTTRCCPGCNGCLGGDGGYSELKDEQQGLAHSNDRITTTPRALLRGQSSESFDSKVPRATQQEMRMKHNSIAVRG